MKLDLTISRDYDIAAALRGPDVHTSGAERAKYLTSAVIRHFVGAPHKIGFVYSPEDAQHFWKCWFPDKQQEVRDFLLYNSHFTDHFLLALHHLCTSVPDVSAEARAYSVWLGENVMQDPRFWLPQR